MPRAASSMVMLLVDQHGSARFIELPPGVLPSPRSGGGGAWVHAPGCNGIMQPYL
jgi:hypothetical protein